MTHRRHGRCGLVIGRRPSPRAESHSSHRIQGTIHHGVLPFCIADPTGVPIWSFDYPISPARSQAERPASSRAAHLVPTPMSNSQGES